MKTRMRLALLLLISIALGTAVGYGLAIGELGAGDGPRKGLGESPFAATGNVPQKNPNALGKFSIDGRSFNFGVLPPKRDSQHHFRVKNVGDGPLALKQGSSSCQCTVAEIEKNVLQPGEETIISVSYAGKEIGPFSQHVTVKSSDPDEPEVALHVYGQIRPWIVAEPDRFVLGGISSRESRSVELRVYGFREEPMSIVKEELSDPSIASFFDISRRPMTAEELSPSHATSGYVLSVTIKSGLPQKRIEQKIRLTTNDPDSDVLQIPIEATVGEVTIVGVKGWNAEKRLLDLGTINRRDGADAQLSLLVRGPSRATTSFRVASVSPESLEARLEPSHPIGQDQSLWQTPLAVHIPPNGPLSSHLGAAAGKWGEIVIESNHPDAPKTTLFVRFAVEE